MKIKSVTIENFRGYYRPVTIDFSPDITTLVGPNDIGKSTILEALDIFFNEGKGTGMSEADINNKARKKKYATTRIRVDFCDLPEKIILDNEVETTLNNEYLILADGTFAVECEFDNAQKRQEYVYSFRPDNTDCDGLLSKTNDKLKKILDKLQIEGVNTNINSEMRTAILTHFDSGSEMFVEKRDAISKTNWNNIKKYFPDYYLFKADRNNSEHDDEIRLPIYLYLKSIFEDDTIQGYCKTLSDAVSQSIKAASVEASNILAKVDASLVSSISPRIPELSNLKWPDLFKGFSLYGENDVKIDKRGSGVRRMVLLSFFLAESKRKASSNKKVTVLAVEEPETALHYNHQKCIMKMINDSSLDAEYKQIILTTHNRHIVAQSKVEDVRVLSLKSKEVQINRPSLLFNDEPLCDEISYVVFGEASPEYHDVLYSYLVENDWLKEYRGIAGLKKGIYKRMDENVLTEDQLTKTEIIRHQIHHPENKLNAHYTEDELKKSIDNMRAFIMRKQKSAKTF